MDSELSKNLKSCKVKKSVIERLLDLPKNSLSGMINGTRPTPKTTEEKLQNFINELLFKTAAEAILNSTETPIPNGVIITGPIVDMVKNPLDLVSTPTDDTGPHRLKFPDDISKFPGIVKLNTPEPWVKKIEDYCGIAGITPEELIEQHAMRGAKKTMIEVPKEEKKKDPIQVKGKYDPFKNPKFMKLHGQQKEEEKG